MKEFLKRKKHTICLLSPIFFGVIYMILCILNLQQSIWFDESYSAYLTRFTFGDIWSLTAQDVHPPLYYFILKIWGHFFGHTDYALRMLSVIFGALSIIAVYLWIKYRFGKTAAIFTSLAYSLSPTLIRYGQEMRMYTMVLFIVFTATYVLEIALNTKDKKCWHLYASLVALGMWTHYFTAFAWLAHLVYIAHRLKMKPYAKDVIFKFLPAVALYIPWIPGFVTQVCSVQSGFWIGKVSLTTIANYFTEALVYEKSDYLLDWSLIAFLFEAILLIYLWIKYGKKTKFLNLLTFLPLIALILVSMPPLSPMFVPRYVIYSICLMPVMLVLYLVIDYRKRKNIKFTTTSIAILVICNIIGLVNVYSYGNTNLETDEKSISKELYEQIILVDNERELPIIVNDCWLYYDLAFYTSEEHPVLFIDADTDYPYGSSQPLKQSYVGRIDDIDEFLSNNTSFWYVGQAPDESELEFKHDKRYRSVEINEFTDKYSNKTYQIIRFDKV